MVILVWLTLSRSLSWLTAIVNVTPVPKVPKPASLSESVTLLLSRLTERLVVSRWLFPALRQDEIQDQFGFRQTGSTTAALIFLHTTSLKCFKRCTYVRSLMVDYS